MTEIIFLLGHRAQRGKDRTADIIQNCLDRRGVSHTRTFFAKKLKKHCAERYSLDFERMELDEYKKSRPSHLGGLSVRDVLLKEGNFAGLSGLMYGYLPLIMRYLIVVKM